MTMQHRIFSSTKLAKGLAALLLASAACCAHGAENFLKAQHESSLVQARAEEKSAKTPMEQAFALQAQAARLNSLGRSEQALALINRAVDLLEPSTNKDVLATKAGVLFALNDPQGALAVLAPKIKETRDFAAGKSPGESMGALATYSEGFVTATFAHMQLEQWHEALGTLADAQAPLEGPSFYAYKSLVYRYIMARAQDPSLAQAELERSAVYYASHDKSHYGALLRMWQGEDTLAELAKILADLPGLEQQDAFAESLFHGAAYAKFVKGDAARSQGLLTMMNTVAPYGSVEWIYGRRVLGKDADK
ncbi:hypothetical protein [Janthinobacterium sp.]|uniref:hypothetical protein n=1 Tax=Janthinobacterium sp. TaxID=1871054 RepID=UPI00293D6F0C|nr:hypothetical protein [Janthinobacterium sp.]